MAKGEWGKILALRGLHLWNLLQICSSVELVFAGIAWMI